MAFHRSICVERLAALVVALLVWPSMAQAQQPPRSIVVISAGGGDYLKGAGGTLARFIAEGFKVYVIQAGSDEKNSIGLGPAETRLANNGDAGGAAKILGVTEIVNLNNKSGELSQLSSNELRNQMSTLIRFFKPQKLFLPDPFIHYVPEWDQFWTGRAAEETNYTNSAAFLAELTRIGIGGHSIPETYYYSAHRPYRPGEGGHNGARLEAVDITKTFERKVDACLQLRTANRVNAEHVRWRLELMNRPSALLREVTATSIDALARDWLEELASTIGAKHGFSRGEEFNYHGSPPGEKRPLPPWIMERAKPMPHKP
ncbi:MAG: PIG-L deacetylase family protein [Bryobacteraceae bacterium]